MAELYFEDLSVGQTFDIGSVEVTGEEIRKFASRFDPQPFHLDEAKARAVGFESIIASGLHTMCLCQRLVTDSFYDRTDNLAGLGFDEVQFPTPVVPSDTLQGTVTVRGTHDSESYPSRGIVGTEQILWNNEGDVVLEMGVFALHGRRQAD